MALRAARAIAALDGRTQIEDDDVALAATLTLSPRATRLPEGGAEEEPQAEPQDPDPQSEADSEPDHESGDSENDGVRPPRSRMSCWPPRRLRSRPRCWRRSKRVRSHEANRRARANPARRKFRLAADARSPLERARRARGGSVSSPLCAPPRHGSPCAVANGRMTIAGFWSGRRISESRIRSRAARRRSLLSTPRDPRRCIASPKSKARSNCYSRTAMFAATAWR